jgi:hypothetical protein
MAKTYPEQLAQWIERRGLARRDQNLIAFMAVHDDTKAAIEAGYAVKTVWANLRETGRVDLSYKTFLNYVKRVIRPLQKNGGSAPLKPGGRLDPSVTPPPRGHETTPVRVMPLPTSGFTYNPVPNKEELL